VGAIAVIRLSGPETYNVLKGMFSRDLENKGSHTVHHGQLKDGDRIIDDVVVAIFRNPNSYTGEDVAEISCHGSTYVQQEIIRVLVDKGVRMAKGGEFTMRAFANGKMDLSQAEAVADLIASESAASFDLAMHQLRGGFSKEINDLRERLIHFASLIELELDFAEEDVEFADRQDLKDLVDEVSGLVKKLVDSFATGKVVKDGVPVAILGAPNMGKSTLLNALLNEDRAIVSDIPGTTRDSIEDSISIGGIWFRFIDTAGIRETEDEIESMGVKRALDKGREASIVLYLIDSSGSEIETEIEIERIRKVHGGDGKLLLVVGSKADLADGGNKSSFAKATEDKEKSAEPFDSALGKSARTLFDLELSAKTGQGLEELQSRLVTFIETGLTSSSTVVTNARHYEALSNALNSLIDVRKGLDQDITGDFLAIDIRKALHHLGEITGEITTDDLLGNIFSKFCIGK
jgi:tRNA modification GTPase